MTSEMNTLIDRYVAWLREKTTIRAVSDWTEITTPYLDRHNDYLQVYAKVQDGAIILTDDGYTLQDLAMSGCKLDTDKRQALLKMTLNGFGVQLSGERLQVKASVESFPVRKHSLIQAMLAINDMFYLAAPHVASLFYEDVVAWMDLYGIRYTPRVKFTGKSGYDHLFDFVIPKSRTHPERIVQALNRPARQTADSVNWAWFDTREVRSSDARAYAFLNDIEQNVSGSVIEALANYDIKPVLWSKRDEVREELAA